MIDFLERHIWECLTVMLFRSLECSVAKVYIFLVHSQNYIQMKHQNNQASILISLFSQAYPLDSHRYVICFREGKLNYLSEDSNCVI